MGPSKPPSGHLLQPVPGPVNRLAGPVCAAVLGCVLQASKPSPSQPFWRTPAARVKDYQWALAAFPHTCFASNISGKRILTHLAFGQAFAAGATAHPWTRCASPCRHFAQLFCIYTAPILNLFCTYFVSIFHVFCSYCSPVVHLLSALSPSSLRRIFQLFCTYCVSIFASVLHVFCNYFQRLFAAAFTFVWQLSSFSFAQLLNLLCTGFAPIT